MKKILVIGLTSNLGGIEKFIINYCQNMSRENICFDLFINSGECPIENDIKKLANMNVCKFNIKYIKKPLSFKKTFKKMLVDNKYDAIWVNACSLTMIYYLRFAKQVGIKTRIIHSHNSNNESGNITARMRQILHLLNKKRIKKYATDYWACSMKAAKYFYPQKLLDTRVKIINNAIDIEKFKYDEKKREEYRSKLKIQNDDTFVIGHVGRFSYQKNQMYLLKVFENFHRECSNSILVMIGDGEDRSKIEKSINELKLDKNVILLGKQEDVNYWMQSFDLFILPSLYEGLPIVGIEAQAEGLPCLFSDRITQELEVNKNINFIKLEDKSEWTRLLKYYKTNKVDRKQIDRLYKNYDITIEAKKMELFFEEI